MENKTKKTNTIPQKQIKKPENNVSPVDSVCKLLTGLTFSEYKTLREDKEKLNKKNTRPTTAQQTIQFEKMYRDGICLVGGKHYTKMLEFYDTNYALLDETDQAQMCSIYSKFINFFSPEHTFQLFLFNRRVPEEILIKQFEIPLQDDYFDDLREEFSNMLKKQSAKGTNGILKSKFLVYGIEAEDISEARSKLSSMEKDIVRNLRDLGARTELLDGEARLRILHDFFNQGTMDPFRFSWEDLAASGHSVKDYIAPPAFDFRIPSRFKIGKMMGSVYSVELSAPKLGDKLLKRILDIDDNISVSLQMQSKDPLKAMKDLKEVLSNVQASKINEQKKAVRSGYDMDIMPSDINTYEHETMELLDELNSTNQKMINISFMISCFANNKKDLDNLIARVKGIIEQERCGFMNLQYQQEDALNAMAPIGANIIGFDRDLPTKNIAVLMPFHTQELFQGGSSLYYGLNQLSNNMIMADRKNLRTPNGLILGTPGSGKSFSAKREMLMSFLITRDDILICDPEGEYFPMVSALHGQVIRLATNSTDYLNPMDLKASRSKSLEETLNDKSAFIITLCDSIAGQVHPLENDEKGIIDRCIRIIYDKYLKTPVPENMPVLEDLYNELMKYNPLDYEESKSLSAELSKQAREKAIRIANSLLIFVHGSQNYFNHRSTVDIDNRIVCFDIRDLSSQLKDLGMLIVQDAVWNKVSANRDRKVATRYYCDEFHLLLREPQTAAYMVEIWKRFRKWGGIPTGITQNVTDFFGSSQIEGIVGNSDFKYLLNQSPNDKEILADAFDLSDEELKFITGSEAGSGLILFDNIHVPFVDKYPKNTKSYEFMNTKPQEEKDNPENDTELATDNK